MSEHLLSTELPPKKGLSSTAEAAVADLDRLIGVLGTSGLSRNNFKDLLRGILGPQRVGDAGKLFDKLIVMCKEAEALGLASGMSLELSPVRSTNLLDGKALRCLYAYHPSYPACPNPMDTALALTNHVKMLYESSLSTSAKEERGIDDDVPPKSLNRSAVRSLVESLSTISCVGVGLGLPSESSVYEEEKKEDDLSLGLSSSSFLSAKEIESAVDELMTSNGTQARELDLEMMASSLLRYGCRATSSGSPRPVNHKDLLGGALSEKLFDPLRSPSEDFVAALDASVLSHDAVRHHLLTSFSMGSWGALPGTLAYLSDFMQAYRSFTSTFCTHLIHTTELVAAADPSGHHAQVLEENLEEEQGIYDQETVGIIRKLGLDPNLLCNVPHKDLYLTCSDRLRELSESVEGSLADRRGRPGLTPEECAYIAKPLVDAFESACDPIQGGTAHTAISAMYAGSELLVAKIYSKLSAYLLTLVEKNPDTCPVTKQDLAFFLLHIDMDVEHADHMRSIVVDLASTEALRLSMARTVDEILRARVEFYDRFIEAAFPPTGHGGEDSAKLYNKQSNNWVRKGATCLSDFTGRPVVFEMCEPFVTDAHVLDVGCGEGYGARKLVEMGAKRIVGLDVSPSMIDKANSNPLKSSRETYVTCDADKILETFWEKPATLGLVPGKMLDRGSFDMAVAIFLFNYTSITKMKAICDQIYKSLKPGGHFIFSVPHPFMLNAHGSKESSGNTFSFSKGESVKADSYFSLRDRKFGGVIRTLDGRDLNVKMLFKTVSDYIDTIGAVGFDLAKLHEARVLPEHVSAHPEFFESVKDSPLHIVFDVVKPLSSPRAVRVPKSIRWSSYEKSVADNILTVTMPKEAADELLSFAKDVYDDGFTEETYQPRSDEACRLVRVTEFATNIRSRLLHTVGAVHITGLGLDLGLDLDPAGSAATDDDESVEVAKSRAKLAYYILSSLIGRVDGGARGRLFDVMDKGLATSSDNVLFSVSREEAPWHTDGASADRSYEGVGLLCLTPATEGGSLHLSNAGSALESLVTNGIPKFLSNELLRPLPRDILENGSGEGVFRGLACLTRNPQLLKLRIRHNSFPIFEREPNGGNHRDSGNRIRFRYMRQWVESGHQKGGLEVSPLLKVAMDALDASLDREKVASLKLKRGDILYCNNMNFAHARDAFRNGVGEPPRHNVRVWMKLQECE